MDTVPITIPSLMDPFITNLRCSQQVVIKPGRASEQIKLDLAQLDPSKMRIFLKLKLSCRFQAVLTRWVIKTNQHTSSRDSRKLIETNSGNDFGGRIKAVEWL